MPNFETVGSINLQSGDRMPWNFYIPPAESVTVKGAIPYNTTVASVSVTAYDEDENDVTSQLISGSPAVEDNVISVVLTYPVTAGDGRYKLTFECTLSTGYVRQFDFERVIARNK